MPEITNRPHLLLRSAASCNASLNCNNTQKDSSQNEARSRRERLWTGEAECGGRPLPQKDLSEPSLQHQKATVLGCTTSLRGSSKPELRDPCFCDDLDPRFGIWQGLVGEELSWVTSYWVACYTEKFYGTPSKTKRPLTRLSLGMVSGSFDAANSKAYMDRTYNQEHFVNPTSPDAQRPRQQEVTPP